MHINPSEVPEMIGNIPNLDGLTEEDLEKFAKEASECAALLQNLQAYAVSAHKARQKRAAGFIESAMRYEEACQRIYGALPRWARW